MFKNKRKTSTVNEVRVQMLSLGDKMNALHEETNDLKSAELALKFYNGAISASKQQIIYKKLTGKPGIIPFMED
jgi:hypothetical protein